MKPLLVGEGLLAELSVRLKLVYALGVIRCQKYDEDAELLMGLHEGLQQDPRDYYFTNDKNDGAVWRAVLYRRKSRMRRGMKRWLRYNGRATSK